MAAESSSIPSTSSSSMTPATATMLVKLASSGTSPNADRGLSEYTSGSGGGAERGGGSVVSKALSSAFANSEEDSSHNTNQHKVQHHANATQSHSRGSPSYTYSPSPQENARYRSSPTTSSNAVGNSARNTNTPTAFGRDSDDFVMIDDPTGSNVQNFEANSTWKNSDQQVIAPFHDTDGDKDRDRNHSPGVVKQTGSPSAHWYGADLGRTIGNPSGNMLLPSSVDTTDLGGSSTLNSQQSSLLTQCAHRCQYISSVVAAMTKHADSVVKEILARHGKTIAKELDREAILGLGARDRDGERGNGVDDREVSPRQRSSSSMSGDCSNIFSASTSNQELDSSLQLLSDALCVPFAFYLHSMNYLQDAIQRTASLKRMQQQQYSSPSSAPTSPSPAQYFISQLDSLITGLSQRFDQLMGRAEGCQKWIRADSTCPVPEPFIYKAALKLGQEAAVEELLGNLSV